MVFIRLRTPTLNAHIIRIGEDDSNEVIFTNGALEVDDGELVVIDGGIGAVATDRDQREVGG